MVVNNPGMADDVSTGGSTAPGPESNHAAQRVGSADRQSAVDALSEHTRAGRLTAQEYEDRSQSAKHALTWAELHQLFTDLPAPHPAPGTSPVRSPQPEPLAPGRPVSSPPAGQVDHGADVRAGGGLIPEHVGIWLVSLMPFIALALFFIFGSWLFFLLIPAAGIVVYGPHDRRDRHERRDRRR